MLFLKSRIEREQITVGKMIDLYCRLNHKKTEVSNQKTEDGFQLSVVGCMSKVDSRRSKVESKMPEDRSQKTESREVIPAFTGMTDQEMDGQLSSDNSTIQPFNHSAKSHSTIQPFNHSTKYSHLCDECQNLKNYAFKRLEKCPFHDEKPTCLNCHIHCYKKDMKEKIKQVMRFSGPKMLLYHPVLAIWHLIDNKKKKEVEKRHSLVVNR